MQSSVHRTWVFNSNVSNHRGVWHVADGAIPWEVHPYKVEERQHKIYKYHGKNCVPRYVVDNSVDIFSYRRGRYVYDCVCGLGTDEDSIDTGETWTEVTTYPEYKTAKAVPVLCHQVEVRLGGYPHTNMDYRKQFAPGQRVEFVASVEEPFVFVGPKPPGPTCSRCLTKAQKDGTV